MLTGLPVMESPRAMIRTWADCAEMPNARVSMTPKTARRERKFAMADTQDVSRQKSQRETRASEDLVAAWLSY
jgi:hypothetical protein